MKKGTEEKLEGKVVFISGASNGIGAEAAVKFAAEGTHLVLAYYKDEAESRKVKQRCVDAGAKSVEFLKLNLMEDESIRKAVKQTLAKHKKIDVLVNNAGTIVWKPVEKQTFEEIDRQVSTNLTGLMKITREFMPHVREAVVNVASKAGKVGFAELAPYCATKFGIRGFTQALAEEYPALRVYAVNPGYTAKKMTHYFGLPAEKVGEIIVNAVKGKYPVANGGDIDVSEVLKL